MKKHLSIQISSGYTIIEIIISVFILVMLFASIQAGYRQYILVKSLDSAKGMIVSDIKLAKEYALAGKKPPGCMGLSGYIYSTDSTNNRYFIIADCITDVEIKKVDIANLARGIIIGSDISVLFKIMGMGTNVPEGSYRSFNLSQQTTGNIRTVTITSAGEVK